MLPKHHEALTSFARRMARDVKEAAAGHIAVMHSLQRLLSELEIPLDDVVTTLYPIEGREADWREAGRTLGTGWW